MGKKAINISFISSGVILMHYPDGRYSLGAGNLVIFQNKLYFSTCLHVIFDTIKRNLKTIGQIYLRDNTKLIPTGNVIINSIVFSDPKYDCNYNASFDYALIEIQNNQSYYQYAANISQTPLKFSDKLRGIISYYRGSYLEGIVQEIGNHPNAFFTSTGGVPGFSGGGLFNEKGYLQAIHHGAGRIFGESTSEGFEEFDMSEATIVDHDKLQPLNRTIRNTINACSNNINSTKCIHNIINTLKLASRNPRSEVLDASYLNKLLDKNSRIGSVYKINYANIEYELLPAKQWVVVSINSTTKALNTTNNSTYKRNEL